MNFQSLFNAVLVLPLAENERTAPSSQVVIPGTSLHAGTFDEKGGTAGQYSDRGRVVAVGTGYKYGKKFIADWQGSSQGVWEEFAHTERIPLDVNVGDLVLYAHKGGQDYTEDGVRYRIIPESQIEGVLEADICQVSWEMGDHQNRLVRCLKEAKYRAFGIGNEGRQSFRVCETHAEVATLDPELWAVEPLADCIIPESQIEGVLEADICQVSWEMGDHQNRLVRCLKEAKYRAFGIGNEGRQSFRVCETHAEVATLDPELWAVEPLADCIIPESQIEGVLEADICQVSWEMGDHQNRLVRC